jgi:hypothetical protein
MVMKTTRPTDKIALVGAIDPDAQGTGDVSTGWVSAANFNTFMAVVMAGTLGASATLDAKIEQATDDSGTGAKDVTGKAITQLVKASNDDDQAIIEFCGEDMDVDGGFTHVRLTMSVGTAASDVAGLLFGIDARFGPASDNDADTVVEIVGLA